jgi:hypothetical protein
MLLTDIIPLKLSVSRKKSIFGLQTSRSAACAQHEPGRVEGIDEAGLQRQRLALDPARFVLRARRAPRSPQAEN